MTLLYLQPFLRQKSPSPSNGSVYPAVTFPVRDPPLSAAGAGYTEDKVMGVYNRRCVCLVRFKRSEAAGF